MRTIRMLTLTAALAAALATPAAQATEPLTICAHVPITGAEPIPRHQSRFGQFYFDYVNAELGGVDGRPVRMLAFDDGYYPAGARAAAEKCMREGAVAVVGASGVDQEVSVAKWADTRGVPYFIDPSSETSLADLDWHWMLGASDERKMRAMADTVVTHLEALGGGEQVGIGMIRTHSPFYEGGHDAFVEALRAHGRELAVDRVAQKDAVDYTAFWNAAVARDVGVVVSYMGPRATQRLQQQRPPTHRVGFVTIEAQYPASDVAPTASELTRNLAFDEDPLYDADDDSLPWADEIDQFLEIFEAYSKEQEPGPDELDWRSYLRAKRLHRILDALDGDTSASAIAALMDDYTEPAEAAAPSCPLSFDEDRVGGTSWNTRWRADDRWWQIETCTQGVPGPAGPSMPQIACGDTAVRVVTYELTCQATDSRAGIDSFVVRASGDAAVVYAWGEGGCAPEVAIAARIPPGLHGVTISATSCKRVTTSASVLVVSTTT